MSELIKTAETFAKIAHEEVNQKRKFTGENYFVHCEEVASFLKFFNLPDELIAAGYLHDTVEDTNTTIEDIEYAFGEKVAYFVSSVTEDKSIPRLERKELTRKKFADSPVIVRCLKLADMLSNTSNLPFEPESITDKKKMKKHKKWFKVYVQQQEDLLKSMTDNPQKIVLSQDVNLAKAYETLIVLVRSAIFQKRAKIIDENY